jgi:hypothetical protein
MNMSLDNPSRQFCRYIACMTEYSANPDRIAHGTLNDFGPAGDSADQADRLAMIMEAEAIRNASRGTTGEYAGEGSLDGMSYPMEDTVSVIAMEDADDSSDDPMHAGGLNPPQWIPAEVAAMHVVTGEDNSDNLDTVDKDL